jgi:hypothetical protein
MHDKIARKTDASPMKKVGAAVAVFYVVALLLNAEGLLRNAEGMAYGTQRQVCVAVAKPVAALANRIGMTTLRALIERAMVKTRKGE